MLFYSQDIIEDKIFPSKLILEKKIILVAIINGEKCALSPADCGNAVLVQNSLMRSLYFFSSCQVTQSFCPHSICSFNISIYRVDSKTVLFILLTPTLAELRPTPGSGTRSPTFDLHSRLSPSLCRFTDPYVRLRLSKPHFPTVVFGTVLFLYKTIDERAV